MTTEFIKTAKYLGLYVLITMAIISIIGFVFLGRDRIDEQQKILCFKNNNWDYEECLDDEWSDAELEQTRLLWEREMEEMICLEWNYYFMMDSFDMTCNTVVRNNTCTYHLNHDITVHWHDYNRSDRYRCTRLKPYEGDI